MPFYSKDAQYCCVCILQSPCFVIDFDYNDRWRQEGHPAKIAPVYRTRPTLQFTYRHVRAFVTRVHGIRRPRIKKRVKVVDLYIASTRSISKTLRYSTHCQGIIQFYMFTLCFIRNRNEPHLPLPSQPQLVLIYRPLRDGRLSSPGRDSNLQPPDCKSGTLPHSQ